MLKAISQLFQKKPPTEPEINDAWRKHIKPILDSWEWDNYSWVWEPFFAKYPNLSDEQRTQVEDALAMTAFDRSNEKLAIKALSIAEELHRSNLASPRLSELFRGELRKQFARLQSESEMPYYYILAFSSFQLVDSIPHIKLSIGRLEKMRADSAIAEDDNTRRSYKELMRACVISLSKLRADEGLTALIHFRSAQEKEDIEKLIKDFQGKAFAT